MKSKFELKTTMGQNSKWYIGYLVKKAPNPLFLQIPFIIKYFNIYLFQYVLNAKSYRFRRFEIVVRNPNQFLKLKLNLQFLRYAIYTWVGFSRTWLCQKFCNLKKVILYCIVIWLCNYDFSTVFGHWVLLDLRNTLKKLIGPVDDLFPLTLLP